MGSFIRLITTWGLGELANYSRMAAASLTSTNILDIT